jgi:hypothetical protein
MRSLLGAVALVMLVIFALLAMMFVIVPWLYWDL